MAPSARGVSYSVARCHARYQQPGARARGSNRCIKMVSQGTGPLTVDPGSPLAALSSVLLNAREASKQVARRTRALLALCHGHAAIGDGGVLKLARMGNRLAASGWRGNSRSKQIVVPNHAWAVLTTSRPRPRSGKAATQPLAADRTRRPAPRARTSWRTDASQDAWDGWAGDTIIISGVGGGAS